MRFIYGDPPINGGSTPTRDKVAKVALDAACIVSFLDVSHEDLICTVASLFLFIYLLFSWFFSATA